MRPNTLPQISPSCAKAPAGRQIGTDVFFCGVLCHLWLTCLPLMLELDIQSKNKVKNPDHNITEILQSLIQKALRRADLEMTSRAMTGLIHRNNFGWLKRRLAVLTFEECWTYGLQVSFSNDEKVVVDQILKLTGTVKNRNAAGLGSLAFQLFGGDESVLNGSEGDQGIKFISNAITHPREFWKWTVSQLLGDMQKTLVENAFVAYWLAEQEIDRSFMLAAAYLAITTEIPETRFIKPLSSENFPLWIAIDMHTQKGTVAISEAARRTGIQTSQALWLTFYFEGALCNEIIFSPWWEREQTWRIKSLGMTMEEGRKRWERLRPAVIELLKEDVKKLQRAIAVP